MITELFARAYPINGAEVSRAFRKVFRLKRTFILSSLDFTVSKRNFSSHALAQYANYLFLFTTFRCFKREFTEAVALRMWEACWSNYLTDYFHLFLCLAIIAVYADDVVAQDLRTDEMLLHFSSLGRSKILLGSENEKKN